MAAISKCPDGLKASTAALAKDWQSSITSREFNSVGSQKGPFREGQGPILARDTLAQITFFERLFGLATQVWAIATFGAAFANYRRVRHLAGANSSSEILKVW